MHSHAARGAFDSTAVLLGNDTIATGESRLISTGFRPVMPLKLLKGFLILTLGMIMLLCSHSVTSLPQSRPLWTRFVQMLVSAVEYPFIFALHPTVLTNGVPTVHSHTDGQLLLQVVFFFAIEVAFQNCILSFVTITPESPATNGKISAPVLGIGDEHLEDAENTVLDFLRSRGTLMLSIAFLGTFTPLTPCTGSLHPMAMILWTITEHLVDYRREKVVCVTS